MKKVVLMTMVLCLPVTVLSHVSIIDTVKFNEYSEALGVAMNPVTNILYVALSNEGILAAIDGVTHASIGNITGAVFLWM